MGVGNFPLGGEGIPFLDVWVDAEFHNHLIVLVGDNFYWEDASFPFHCDVGFHRNPLILVVNNFSEEGEDIPFLDVLASHMNLPVLVVNILFWEDLNASCVSAAHYCALVGKPLLLEDRN